MDLKFFQKCLVLVNHSRSEMNKYNMDVITSYNTYLLTTYYVSKLELKIFENYDTFRKVECPVEGTRMNKIEKMWIVFMT